MLRSSLAALLAVSLLSSVARCDPGDWLGTPPTPSTPVETSKDLLGVPIDDSGARIYRLNLEPRQIAPSSIFSADGKFLFLLQKNVGVLQIEVPAFRLVRTLALPCDGGTISLSSEGLVVGSNEPSTMWVVNPQSLKVVRSFKVEDARQLTATPKSPLVFVGSGNKIFSVDARSGDTVGYQSQSFQIDRRNGDQHQSVPLGSFGSVQLSSDGNTVYSGFNGTISRFSIQGRTLVAEANSDLLALGIDPLNPALALSPDGRYVALPGNSGNFRDSFRNVNTNQTWIFKTSDLREPVLRLEGGSSARAVGFDPAAGRIYLIGVPGFRPALSVFDSTGKLLKTIAFPGKDNDFDNFWDQTPGWTGGGWTNGRPMAVYPSGNRVLVGGETGLFWFELPVAFTSAPRTPEKLPRVGGEAGQLAMETVTLVGLVMGAVSATGAVLATGAASTFRPSLVLGEGQPEYRVPVASTISSTGKAGESRRLQRRSQ